VQLISWLYQIGVGLFNISEACNKRAIIFTDVKEREEKKDKKSRTTEGNAAVVRDKALLRLLNK
jgi:hypothetical protein